MTDVTHAATGAQTTAAQARADSREMTAQALSAMTDAWHSIQAARGHAYEFHHHAGLGDAHLVRAVSLLRAAGHHDLADAVCHHLVGRGVAEDRWSFQVVEDQDDDFVRTLMALEEQVRSRGA